MYVESLRSPRCQGQSILIKETPTPVHLQYTYTNERKECLLTQITKERMVSVSTDKLIIPRKFGFVSPFFEIFLKQTDKLEFVFLIAFLLLLNNSSCSLSDTLYFENHYMTKGL